MAGFLLGCTLLPDFVEHRVRCDGFFGVSIGVGFGLCHVDQRVGEVLFGVVIS